MNLPLAIEEAQAAPAPAPEWNTTNIDPIVELVRQMNRRTTRIPKFAIVGGAVRDTFHGKPFKDVDIVVLSHGRGFGPQYVEGVLRALGVHSIEVFRHQYEGSPVDWVIKGVYQNTHIDVIRYPDTHRVVDVVENFDLNVNTFWMSATGRIYSLPGTCRKAGDEVRVINPHQWPSDQMVARIEKLHAKYPNFDWGKDNRLIEALTPFVAPPPQ